MSTFYKLIFNHRETYLNLNVEKSHQPLLIILLSSLINGIVTYFTIESQITMATQQLSEKIDHSLNGLEIMMSVISIIIGSLFPLLTIAANALLFFLFAKFLINYSNYKYIFKFFTYIFPITLAGNVLNYFLKNIFPISGVRWTSLNAVFQTKGPLGLFLNSLDLFQIWTIVLIYYFLVVSIKMPKSSAFSAISVYCALIVLPIFIL
ncbi:YIP1 family protein [Paenibacillus sp. FSL W8-0186]|uniref:YIP1 family protein n=1 Tax=Paenibacillus TaxID=44249 RepID=UPI001BD16A2B|nr:YIP1 family protein [Paenibacillus woosongensis]